MKTSFDKFMASSAVKENTNVELANVKVDLGIKEEMAKIQKMADQLENQGKELFKNEQKAVVMLKEAYKLLQPIGNFQETQIESIIADLKTAGLDNSKEYKELTSSYDYLSRLNATTKRILSQVSKALN
jgi:membrane-bound ClpP family serine protease